LTWNDANEKQPWEKPERILAQSFAFSLRSKTQDEQDCIRDGVLRLRNQTLRSSGRGIHLFTSRTESAAAALAESIGGSTFSGAPDQ